MGLSYNKMLLTMTSKALDKNLILHITQGQNWEKARQEGLYKTSSLETEGFIHCSKIHQVIEVANYLFEGQQDLVLLCINPEMLSSELRYEALGLPEDYPHIYGPINLGSVEKVIDFPANEDGVFQLPQALKS
jgi:uncharacterized protein (DUF952 family)